MRSQTDLAADYATFLADGRRALLDGDATYDLPLTEGGRWGMSTVMRPTGAVVPRLESLAAEAGRAAGPGHWTHDRTVLHFTLRSLEPYRRAIPPADPMRRACAAALDEAVRDIAPFRMRIEGISPHAGGILAFGYPEDDTVWTLQSRYTTALGPRTYYESWSRDRWYISLVHFAAPLADPKRVVAWCDEHTDLQIGTTEIDAADIVQAEQHGPRVHLNTLERAIMDRC